MPGPNLLEMTFKPGVLYESIDDKVMLVQLVLITPFLQVACSIQLTFQETNALILFKENVCEACCTKRYYIDRTQVG